MSPAQVLARVTLLGARALVAGLTRRSNQKRLTCALQTGRDLVALVDRHDRPCVTIVELALTDAAEAELAWRPTTVPFVVGRAEGTGHPQRDVALPPESPARSHPSTAYATRVTAGGKRGDGLFLVMEVGGSNLRAARFDPSTRSLVDVRRRPTPNHLGGAGDVQGEALQALRRLAGETLGEDTPTTVGVAYPGPVGAAGTVLATPTLLGPGGPPLALGREVMGWWPGARVLVLNDVTAAGYRVVASGERDFCILTVGSGIGNKVFLDGRPIVGPHGRGGELGHLQVDDGPGAPECDCGGRGHLGGIASGRGCLALARRAAAADPDGARGALGAVDPDDFTNEILVAAFAAGDPWVRGALIPAITHLGRALASVHVAVGVERFVLVGGFALAMGEPYRQAVVAAAERSCWQLGQAWDEMVVLGTDDDDHGMLGAGVVAAGLVEP